MATSVHVKNNNTTCSNEGFIIKSSIQITRLWHLLSNSWSSVHKEKDKGLFSMCHHVCQPVTMLQFLKLLAQLQVKPVL